MGEMSMFASKFSSSSISLKEYDEVLRFFKKHKEVKTTPEIEAKIEKILRIITPVSEVIQGKLSDSTEIDENSVLNIIRQKHEKEWFSYKEIIVELNLKLQSERFELSKQDIDVLNDIGDALDVECGTLFKRLSAT